MIFSVQDSDDEDGLFRASKSKNLKYALSWVTDPIPKALRVFQSDEWLYPFTPAGERWGDLELDK